MRGPRQGATPPTSPSPAAPPLATEDPLTPAQKDLAEALERAARPHRDACDAPPCPLDSPHLQHVLDPRVGVSDPRTVLAFRRVVESARKALAEGGLGPPGVAWLAHFVPHLVQDFRALTLEAAARNPRPDLVAVEDLKGARRNHTEVENLLRGFADLLLAGTAEPRTLVAMVTACGSLAPEQRATLLARLREASARAERPELRAHLLQAELWVVNHDPWGDPEVGCEADPAALAARYDTVGLGPDLSGTLIQATSRVLEKLSSRCPDRAAAHAMEVVPGLLARMGSGADLDPDLVVLLGVLVRAVRPGVPSALRGRLMDIDWWGRRAIALATLGAGAPPVGDPGAELDAALTALARDPGADEPFARVAAAVGALAGAGRLGADPARLQRLTEVVLDAWRAWDARRTGVASQRRRARVTQRLTWGLLRPLGGASPAEVLAVLLFARPGYAPVSDRVHVEDDRISGRVPPQVEELLVLARTRWNEWDQGRRPFWIAGGGLVAGEAAAEAGAGAVAEGPEVDPCGLWVGRTRRHEVFAWTRGLDGLIRDFDGHRVQRAVDVAACLMTCGSGHCFLDRSLREEWAQDLGVLVATGDRQEIDQFCAGWRQAFSRGVRPSAEGDRQFLARVEAACRGG